MIETNFVLKLVQQQKLKGILNFLCLENISLFGAIKYKLTDELLLDVGIVTGYEYDVIPMARLRYKNIFMMPAIEKDTTGLVLGVQVDF